MSLLSNRNERESEQMGKQALKKFGPGGLPGQLDRETYSLKRSLFDLPFTDNPMGTQFDSYKDGGQVRGAMQKMPMDGGPIEGPGTGKSDSIKTKLPVKGFVLPVEVADYVGRDKLNAMIALFGQGTAEGREEVLAKVSDGEFLVPPEVVQATGPEYWDGLIAKVTGQSAQPEIGEHGEMMAAGGGLANARNQSAEFWKTAPENPVPVPGRANPANPADMMAARLKTSANTLAQQAPSLRGQMMNQGALPPMSVTPPVTPPMPGAPAYQTPDPHKNFLKNANNMMAGEGAIATGLAYDILNAPQNAGQVNGAIAGLKQRAGFDPNSTPYPSLKNVAMPGYKKGGEVKGYKEGKIVKSQEEIDQETKAMNAKSANITNNGIAGVPNVIGGLKSVASGFANAEATGARGGMRPPVTSNTAENYNVSNRIPALSGAGDLVGNTIEALTPIPETIKAGRFPSLRGTTQSQGAIPNKPVTSGQIPPPMLAGDPAQANANYAAIQRNAAQTQPPQGAIQQAVAQSPSWAETGLRSDSAPQTLDWNESRFSNSGDPVQDASLEQRRGTLASLRGQAEIMKRYGPEIASAMNPGAAVLPQNIAQEQRQNDIANALERDKMALANRPSAPKFAMNEGRIYQQEGADAPEFNKATPKNNSQAAQLINIIEGDDEEASKQGLSLLAKYHPEIYLQYKQIGIK